MGFSEEDYKQMDNQHYESMAEYSKPLMDSRIIELRLDTENILKNIEIFLRGSFEIVILDEITGKKKRELKKFGNAKANEEGIQSLLNWVRGVISPTLVQGNFLIIEGQDYSISYENYIYEINLDIARLVYVNRYKWNIAEYDCKSIIDYFMVVFIPFFTRLIANKERESYSQTMKTIDNTNMVNGKEKSGLLSKIFG
jgi:hypothetical protein